MPYEPDFRPCGACTAMVSNKTGCVHWKPGIKVGKKQGWSKGRGRGTVGRPGLFPPDSPEAIARAHAVLENGGLTPGQGAR